MIEIKEAALNELKKMQFKENQGIRIGSDQELSCSLFIDYTLKLDEKRDGDEKILSDGIPFLLSGASKELLPDKVYLNYTEGSGYKLFTDEGILKANMDIQLS